MSALKRAAEQIATMRYIMGKKGDRFRRLPLPKHPARAEIKYVAFMRRLIDAMSIFTKTVVSEYLPNIADGYNREIKIDGWSDDIENFRIRLKNGYDNIIDQVGVEQEVSKLAELLSASNFGDFQRAAQSVFGVNIPLDEPWKKEMLKSWINENVSLIKKTSSAQAEEIHQIVQRGFKSVYSLSILALRVHTFENNVPPMEDSDAAAL